MSDGGKGTDRKRRRRKTKFCRIQTENGMEESIHWNAAELILEIELRTKMVGSCEGRGYIWWYWGHLIQEAKHEIIFRIGGANQATVGLWWRWDIPGNGGWRHFRGEMKIIGGEMGLCLNFCINSWKTTSCTGAELLAALSLRPWSEYVDGPWTTNVPRV